MIKTVKFGNKEVQLCNNVNWALIYKDQFGIDIVPALVPMLAGALDIFSGMVNELDDPSDVSLKDIAKLSDSGALLDAIAHISGLEFVDFINLTWALAKCADDDLPEPKTWLKEFDEFPVDVIAPEVFSLIAKGVMSSKNLKRLSNLKTIVQPKSTQKQSFSLASSEG